MRPVAVTALCLALVVWFGVASAATTIYVDDDNTTGPWDGSQEHPYQYIGKAVSVAANDDTIIVMPGTYTGEDPQDPDRTNRNISISDKTITLVSKSGPEDTTIDAEDACQVLNLSNAGTTTIEGFTIKDGKDEWGAGIYVTNCNPTVSNCIFVSNRAWGTGSKQGGGLRIADGSEVHVVDCQFEDNYASDNGGGIYCANSDLVVEGCVFLRNEAGGGGAAVYSTASNIEVLDCWFRENEQWDDDNTTYNGGGAISFSDNGGSVDLHICGCTIEDGTAAVHGGAIYIRANAPDSSQGTSVTIEQCLITGNTAAGRGGGIYCYGGGHPAGSAAHTSVVLRDSVVSSNAVLGTINPYLSSGGGAALCLASGGYPEEHYNNSCEVKNCLFADNIGALDGGGLHISSESPSILNSTFADNATSEGPADLQGCTSNACTVVVTDCVFWGADEYTPRISFFGIDITADVTYCDVQQPDSVYPGTGNINKDPLFVSGPLHKYYLSHTDTGEASNSPCVNAGSDTAANLGMDGLTTRRDSVQDSDQVDMGYHSDPVQVQIVDVYWDQSTAQVVITFTTVDGIQYTVQRADADEYSDGLTWSDLTPVTATGPLTTITDNLSTNPLTGDYRFYRIELESELGSHYSRQTAAVFELKLQVGFATRQFFISTPLWPDPDHADVDDVLSTQLNYTGARLDKLIADSGLYVRATYTPGVGWANTFDIVEGEAYWLNVGDAWPIPHKVRLTGYVPEEALRVPLTRDSFAVTRRWMAYSMPRPTTLGDLGLEEAITPFWPPTNEVRLLPLGTTAWKRYFFDGANWREGSLTGPLADDTPIVCGQGILFIHQGVPGQPDVLICPTWYLHPPNVW